MKYPSKGLPVYLASPIYQNKKWELEIRRAGLDWLFSEKCTESNLSEKEIQEVKNSIKVFLADCERIMKENYRDSDLYKRLYPLISNYENN